MRGEIAALVGSRICHDLISPLGAIGNGVELLGLTTGKAEAELDLINDSVASANARIRFFRIAYGAANVDHKIGRSEVLSVLTDIARGGRFTYYWQVEGDQSRRDVRLAFLLLQCIETGMPMGGDVQINCDNARWSLTAHGPRLRIDPDLWATLTNPRIHYDHTAAQVQFALAPLVAGDSRRVISVASKDDSITIRF